MNQRVRIKMCGMTRATDIATAISLGVDALGFIFYPNSPRALTLEQAKPLMADMPAFVSKVAVVVDPDVDFVKQLLAQLPIHYVQFHGNETAQFCQQFKRPYIKAVAGVSTEAIDQAAQAHPWAAAILIDTPSLKHGGSGQAFDWQLIPKSCSKPLILAGGLTADNVKQAATISQAYAVDVCSGVEVSPGIKSPEKMKLFVNALGD